MVLIVTLASTKNVGQLTLQRCFRTDKTKLTKADLQPIVAELLKFGQKYTEEVLRWTMMSANSNDQQTMWWMIGGGSSWMFNLTEPKMIDLND